MNYPSRGEQEAEEEEGVEWVTKEKMRMVGGFMGGGLLPRIKSVLKSVKNPL